MSESKELTLEEKVDCLERLVVLLIGSSRIFSNKEFQEMGVKKRNMVIPSEDIVILLNKWGR